MTRRGLTLIELLIALAITVMLIVSVAFAYGAGMQFQMRVPEQDAEMRRIVQFEERARRIIEGAFLTADETDQTSYFTALSTSGDLTNLDTMVFTTLGAPPTSAFLASTEEFEVLNERFGPQGGLAEVAFSIVPVGEATVEGALYLRVQRPADGDPTQGGTESAILEGVETFAFEFFNGTEWVAEWDTFTAQRRLPAAIRLIYGLVDEDVDRVLTVRVPLSDVTPEDPIVQEIGG